MGGVATGTLMLLMVVYTVLIWIAYHKMYTVIYFDKVHAIGKELIFSFIGGIILTAITIKFWYIVAIIIVVSGLIFLSKMPTKQGKIIVLVGIVIAVIFTAYIGTAGIKSVEDKYENSEENLAEPTTDDPGVYLIENHGYTPTNFVTSGKTYVNDNGEIKYLNMYYAVSFSYNGLHIESIFTINGKLDQRSLTADFRNTEENPLVYYAEGSDGYLSKDKILTIIDKNTFELKYEEDGIDFSGTYTIANESDQAKYFELLDLLATEIGSDGTEYDVEGAVPLEDDTGDEIVQQEDDFGDENFGEEDEYILPESDIRYYSKSELAGLTKEELRIARNEILARHGRMFDSEDLDRYFSHYDWYNPLIDPAEFDMSCLNEFESANISTIKELESEK